MSDRTSMSIIVRFDREPTPAETERFEEIQQEHYGEDWSLGDPDTPTLSFGIQEHVCGGSGELFDQIRTALPEAAEIVVWEDPKYEWLGECHRWKRGMAKPFTAQSDANGLVVLTEAEVEAILDKVATRPAPDAVIEVRELRVAFLSAIGQADDV